MKKMLVDLAPLKASRAFARLWVGYAISGIGAQMTILAVGLQIYTLTRSTFMVALVGGIALLPMVLAGLWGGAIVDAFDRKKVLFTSALGGWVSVALITLLSFLAHIGVSEMVWPFYVLTTVHSVAVTIMGTARTAVTPRLLDTQMVPRAAALNGLSIGLSLTVGPALAGVLAATVALPWVFMADVVLFTAAFIGILGLPHLPPLKEVERPGVGAILSGLRFLRQAPNIRMSYIVDIVAMTFGRPYALFPAAGALAIGGGEITVGFLTAAMAVGTFCASLFSGFVSRTRLHGVMVRRAIMAYGLFVLLFGVVLWAAQFTEAGKSVGTGIAVGADGSAIGSLADKPMVWWAMALSCLALFGMGASDEVSAIFRASIMLVATPDHLRGRMQGIFQVVVTGGPRIGDMYVGVMVATIALWAPMVFGGIAIIVIVMTIARGGTPFARYDVENPTP